MTSKKREIKALINPDMLVWARQTRRLSTKRIAREMGVTQEELAAWETGQKDMTTSQLRVIAALYRRPIVVFYLRKRPKRFIVLKD